MTERRFGSKADALPAADGDIERPELADILDIQEVQALVDDFYELTRFPVSIVDRKGKVLVGVGWKDICVRYHRAHPEACMHCTESDLELSQGVSPGDFRLYKCKNNMWDVATPIIAGGRRLGNVISGQFFFEDEPLDREIFRSQARHYGFDEEAYLAAVDDVPRFEKDFVRKGMAFLVKLARMLSQLSYGNMRLARLLTERAALTESVRESEERLNLALAASRIGAWEWDARTDTVYWSPESRAILALEGKGGALESFRKVIHPEDVVRVMAMAERALAERTPFVEEFRVIHPGGGIRWVSNRGRAEYDRAGKPLRMVGTIQDITERKRAEEEQIRVEARLRQAQKMEALGTLAGGIAHDFNNILGIIIGYSEMAHWNAEEGSPVREDLQHVFRATTRARELVRQILAFSRRSEQEKKPVQIGLIVKEAMLMLRASLPSTIDMKMDIASKSVVLADPTQVHQVLMNLCANAAHAMRENGGVLQVSLTDVSIEPDSVQVPSDLQAGPHVQLTVMDTGPGILPAALDRIFDPFFTTKELGVGTGLGLSVVHGIVRSHGGTVSVDSIPGEGAAFRVLLPAMESVPGQDAVTVVFPLHGRERILIVDDEPELAVVTKRMLEFLGYEVEYRTNGIEALEAFRHRSKESPFDLVVTDLTMPHLTGEDLTRELLRLQPGLPVILCTGFSERMDARRALQLGIRGFIMKPVVAGELAGTIRRILDERRQ